MIFILCILLYLKNRIFLLFFFFIGLILSSFINICLKAIIQEKRPRDNLQTWPYIVKKWYEELPYSFFSSAQLFGMPSGHSLIAVYSLFFYWITIYRWYGIGLYGRIGLLLFCFLCFITLWQRIAYGWHSIIQVIIGGLIGLLISWITILFAKEYIKGNQQNRKDDLLFSFFSS